jgi:hypothetical protein
VFAATAAFSFAFLTNRRWLGFVGAGIAAPFCLFAAGYPLFHWAAPVALAANFVAAYLLSRGRPDVAFTALVPFMMIVTLLAVFALRDITLVRIARSTLLSSSTTSSPAPPALDCPP